MELRQLKYFVKVAEVLNFSEASRQLYITQSTLSQQIKQLEDEMGTRLFNRTSHSVTLTEAGAELLPYAQNTIRSADLCMARISDLNEMSVGTLNIGVTYSFSPILTETIISFMRQYPHIKLNIYYKPMEELMDMLRKQSVDFALAFKPTKPIEGIESHILFQNCLSAIVDRSHPLAAQDRVTLQDLEKYDLALPAQGLQARNYFDQIISSHKNLRVRVELNEVNILLKLLRQTQLVSVLAEATINNETGVKAIPLDIAQNEMTGCIHTLKDTYRKHSMVEFVKMLSESIAVRERQKAWI